jgi:exodeoxyribonuclease VII small subunit
MDKPTLTFEQALAKLEEIVSQIEEGKVSLEESIEKYAQGQDLIKLCRGKIDAAEKKIQILSKAEGETLAVAGQMEDDQPESVE